MSENVEIAIIGGIVTILLAVVAQCGAIAVIIVKQWQNTKAIENVREMVNGNNTAMIAKLDALQGQKDVLAATVAKQDQDAAVLASKQNPSPQQPGKGG